MPISWSVDNSLVDYLVLVLVQLANFRIGWGATLRILIANDFLFDWSIHGQTPGRLSHSFFGIII